MMTIREIRDLLVAHSFFAELEPGDVDLIASCGKNVVFRTGEMMAREGDAAGEFFVVREGRVAVEVHAPGRGALVLATNGPGEVVGWSWLFPPHRWTFDVRAATDVHAIALDGACLRGKCENDTALGYRLMKRFSGILVARLAAARLRLVDLYGKEVGTGV